jgi:hypothetical protein
VNFTYGPSILVFASAGIILALGVMHLVITFVGPQLRPRDPELQARMEAVSPVITSQTTMWKAWIGFNASHAFGAILFGAVYGYLALAHSALLFRSVFLGSLGGLLLLGYAVLAKKYWFSVPFRGIVLAFICYASGFAASLLLGPAS